MVGAGLFTVPAHSVHLPVGHRLWTLSHDFLEVSVRESSLIELGHDICIVLIAVVTEVAGTLVLHLSLLGGKLEV